MTQVRHIFGCNHPDREIKSKTKFEVGLELPAIFCKDCIGSCNVCLKEGPTERLGELELCEDCLKDIKSEAA